MTSLQRCLGVVANWSVLGLAWILTAGASGTPYTIAGTELRELPPSSNGRTYLLYVALPESYATNPTQHYPVLYFPDGYWDFTLMTTTMGTLHADSAVPEAIVVGIGYAGTAPNYSSLRAVDLTPGVDLSFDPAGNSSGHAVEFLNVIATEIIPFIEHEYRADPSYRVLAGNSFGGLFATYVALQRPDLFQGYIASSPSLWWRGNYLQGQELVQSVTRPSWPIRLFFAYATGDGPSITGTTEATYEQIASHHYDGFSVALRVMDGERHNSLKGESYTRGLRFAFAPLAASPALVGTNQKSNLINVSTRGMVGTGESVLIAGFVVRGSESKRVLIRAAGPALIDYGVVGVLADPQVRIQSTTGVLAGENDNWSESAAIVTATSSAGAFPFHSGSRDAALVLTLDPGAYTAMVSGVNGTTGNAEVEVYELPGS